MTVPGFAHGHVITLKDVYDVAQHTAVKVEVMGTQYTELVKDVTRLQSDVDSLKERRLPLSILTVMIGFATLALLTWATFR